MQTAKKIIGLPLVWGMQTPKPIINLPCDTVKFRLRIRPEDPVTAFIKLSDRVERWLVITDEEGHWKLGVLTATNFTSEPIVRIIPPDPPPAGTDICTGRIEPCRPWPRV